MNVEIPVLVRGMTKMNTNKNICIGGIDLNTNTHVRLQKSKTLNFEPYESIQLLKVYRFIGRYNTHDKSPEDFYYSSIPVEDSLETGKSIDEVLDTVASKSVLDHYKHIELDESDMIFNENEHQNVIKNPRYEKFLPEFSMGTFKDFKIIDFDWVVNSAEESSIRVLLKDATNRTFNLPFTDLQIYRYSDSLKKFVLKNPQEIESFFKKEFSFCSLGLTRGFPNRCPDCNEYVYIEDNRVKKIGNPNKFGRIPDFTCSNFGTSKGCGWGFYIDGPSYRQPRHFKVRWLQLNTLLSI